MPESQRQLPESRQRVLLWLGIASLALVLRISAAWLTGAFQAPQLYEYDQMARSLLAGRGLTYMHHGIAYHAFDAPLFPLACAGIYALTQGSVAAVLLIQMLANAATAVLITALGTRLFGRSAGLVSGLLVACHPGLMVYASLKAHPLSFDALCFSVVVWFLLRAQEERTWRRSAWAGLAIGVSLLERPTGMAFLLVGVIWLVLTASRQVRIAQCQRCLLMVACSALVIAPWVVRTARMHHQFVFIRSTSWEVFWRGNNPHATGHSYIDTNQTVLGSLPAEAMAALRRLPDENAQARWFKDQALTFIRQHPAAFCRLTLKKLGYFWWFAPQTGVLYSRSWLRGYQAFYVFLISVALVGLYALRLQATPPQWRAVGFIGLCLFALSLLQSLYYVEGRHRWAVEPLVSLLSGAGVAWLIGISTPARRRVRHPASTTPASPPLAAAPTPLVGAGELP